jgi:hypothetical protein
MDNWIPFTDVNFSDPTIMQYHVDTRDFCCITDKARNEKLDTSKLENYPERFFFSPREVNEILVRLFNESGGPVKWRNLNLAGPAEKISLNWGFKYIRIYRHPMGLIMCNARSVAMRKDYRDSPVDKETLHAH